MVACSRSVPHPMRAPTSSVQDLEQLVALARRFAQQKLTEEAIDLYRIALRLDPKNLGLQLALAQLQRQSRPESEARSPLEAVREAARRNAIDAAHFVGLARLFVERGEPFRAVECLEVARAKDGSQPGPWQLAGKIHFDLKDYDSAAELLARAQRLNPFDRETAELLGSTQYERRQFHDSLAATIDAFLLTPPADSARADRLRRRIKTLRQALEWETSAVVALFHERQELLHTAFDRIEWRRMRFREEESLVEPVAALSVPPSSGAGRLELAMRLRPLAALSHCNDEQLFELANATRLERHPRGSRVLAHGDRGHDFFALVEGEIRIERATGYGTFPLATLTPGTLFGELNFVSHAERSGDAIATQPVTLLRFEAGEMERISQQSAELGVQLYWALWHSLAKKLRRTNEALRGFFAAGDQPENYLRLRRGGKGAGDAVAVDSGDKIRLLREQGLSGTELVTLSTFSRERRYGAGEVLFEEGDEGREMYVVVDGKVLISKFIPGAGEEALAILERGDFFGEMSLIDGEVRSADARAHAGELTVLVLDQDTLQQMLALDAAASRDFLFLLCRLVAKRLREIDEKVIGWYILSGHTAPGSVPA